MFIIIIGNIIITLIFNDFQQFPKQQSLPVATIATHCVVYVKLNELNKNNIDSNSTKLTSWK